MKILWLINIALPEVSLLMNENLTPYGGWLINSSKDLSQSEGIELSVAFPKSNVNSYQKFNGKKITYYSFGTIKSKDKELIKNNTILRNILKEVKPDLVHIYGTESAHTLSMLNACKIEKVKTVISIQGLVSVIAGHLYSNLPFKAIYGFTFRDMLRIDNIAGSKRKFEKNGKCEIESIRKTENIIGRTRWDKACTLQINPKRKYYFCNETLREEFYNHQWDINKCERHSIFLSQGNYPIKGLHYLFEAMPVILKRYPDTKVYIAGKNITNTETLKERIKMSYYSKYIKKMIKKLQLNKNITFTGNLNEKEMCQQYLKSHVFVLPSAIENSPNSLGEAMILGVPCVASFVGGIPDMLRHNEEGFIYQSDAPYMLAYYICELFENEELALKFSQNARRHALETHDIDENTRRLIEIYNEIIDKL